LNHTPLFWGFSQIWQTAEIAGEQQLAQPRLGQAEVPSWQVTSDGMISDEKGWHDH